MISTLLKVALLGHFCSLVAKTSKGISYLGLFPEKDWGPPIGPNSAAKHLSPWRFHEHQWEMITWSHPAVLCAALKYFRVGIRTLPNHVGNGGDMDHICNAEEA